MGNEKEKHTRKNGKGSDEPVSRSINESQRGTKLSEEFPVQDGA